MMSKSFSFLLFALLLQTAGFSQNRSCEHLFIWPFGTESGKQPELAKQLTSDAEEVFLKNNCTVFVSSDFPSLTEKISAVSNVAIIQDIPGDVLKELPITGADKMLIGRARIDNGGNAIVQVTIYTLPGKLMIDTKKMMFSAYELQKDSLRKNKLRQVLALLPEKPAPPPYTAREVIARTEDIGTKPAPPTLEDNMPSPQPQAKPIPTSIPTPPPIPQPTPPPPPTPRYDRAPPPPPPIPYHEVTFVVGKNADQVWVSGYNYLRLTKRSDGSQEASVSLKEGRYEVRVYQNGQLKCNKPFQADRAKTISYPCQ